MDNNNVHGINVTHIMHGPR